MADVLNTGGEAQSVAPEGHDAEMIAAVEAKEAELAAIGSDDTQGTPEEPTQEELLLGKFKSADELAKAYQELERKLSQGSDKEPEVKPEDATPEDANNAVEAAGLNMEALTAHYNESGSLADEHYEALEKAGIPKAYVDQYISGLEAQAANVQNEIFAEVGGQEQFSAMAEWAKVNMPKTELADYNKSVESGDPAVIRSAVMSLAYRYQKAVGRDPKLLNGSGNASVGNSFASVAQLTEAMKDPRYEKDPAYRKSVEERLSNSNIF